MRLRQPFFMYGFVAFLSVSCYISPVMEAPRKPQPGRVKSGASQDVSQNTATLLLTMADTTWRVFVPTILFTGLGIWGDLSVGSKPWLTFTGLIIGLIIAGLLVQKQIKTIKR